MERLTNKREADAQRKEYERRLANGYPRNIPEERFLRLAAYEDTGLTPAEVHSISGEWCAMMSVWNSMGSYDRLRELAEADKDGRVVVLPCKVGERWVDEDGRAVRITAVIASREPFGENINIYFDYEDATPDDAGSDCAANWDYFSRQFTCAETVLDNRKDEDNA